MEIFDETGRRWTLGDKIAAGGEGTVYRLTGSNEFCAKLYHRTPVSPAKQEKLIALRMLPSEIRQGAALPLSLAFQSATEKRAIGILLPLVEGMDIYELYHPQGRSQHFPHADFGFLVAAARNLASVFAGLHEHGVVVGDVNEKNVKVRPNATLNLIDCDSFQVTTGGRLFSSDVGTPLWTPPELQGKSLANIPRTPNHDSFGLAQLIFLLLFCGRYPFAGKPVGKHDFTPEEAIRKHAFAFDPNPNALQTPPLSAPPLDSLPPLIQTLFCAAFRAGSDKPNARPSARHWVDALRDLGGNLARCRKTPTHRHWTGAASCPWCRTASACGLDYFPYDAFTFIDSNLPPTGETPHLALAHKLQSLDLTPATLTPPPESQIQRAIQNQTPVSSLGGWLTSSLLNLTPLQKILQSGKIRNTQAELQKTVEELAAHTRKTSELFHHFHARLAPLHSQARALASELSQPKAIRQKAIENLRREARHAQLLTHLRQFNIQDARIRGIGQGRLRTLRDAGVRNAADITPQAIESLPGFGQGLCRNLLQWRQKQESIFRPNGNPALPADVQTKLQNFLHQHMNQLAEEGKKITRQHDEIRTEYIREIKNLESLHHAACIRRAVLEAQLKELNKRS